MTDKDPRIVVGFFTYLDDSHELDIEFARWGSAAGDHNADYVN